MVRKFIIAVLAGAGLLAGVGTSQAFTFAVAGPTDIGSVAHFETGTLSGPFEDDWVFSFVVPAFSGFPDITILMDPQSGLGALTLQVIRDAEPPTPPVGSPAGFTYTYFDPRTVALADTFVSYTLRIAGIGNEVPYYSGQIGIGVSPVPVPGALPLFASALIGLGALYRRRRSAKH